MLSGNIKFGSSAEYVNKAKNIKIPAIDTKIPTISINLLIAKLNEFFAIFFISINDESV